MATIRLDVTGMTCGHCKQRVEDALNDVPGVYNVFVDLAGNAAEVDGDDTVTREALIEAVKSAGYEAQAAG
jgi:copper chaperone